MIRLKVKVACRSGYDANKVQIVDNRLDIDEILERRLKNNLKGGGSELIK